MAKRTIFLTLFLTIFFSNSGIGNGGTGCVSGLCSGYQQFENSAVFALEQMENPWILDDELKNQMQEKNLSADVISLCREATEIAKLQDQMEQIERIRPFVSGNHESMLKVLRLAGLSAVVDMAHEMEHAKQEERNQIINAALPVYQAIDVPQIQFPVIPAQETYEIDELVDTNDFPQTQEPVMFEQDNNDQEDFGFYIDEIVETKDLSQTQQPTAPEQNDNDQDEFHFYIDELVDTPDVPPVGFMDEAENNSAVDDEFQYEIGADINSVPNYGEAPTAPELPEAFQDDAELHEKPEPSIDNEELKTCKVLAVIIPIALVVSLAVNYFLK